MRTELIEKERPEDIEFATQVAREALSFIEPMCEYKTWTDVGMALKWLSPELFSLWDEWSSPVGPPSYPGTEAMKKKWDSFPENGRLTLGTLLFHAKEAGYIVPNLWLRDFRLWCCQGACATLQMLHVLRH